VNLLVNARRGIRVECSSLAVLINYIILAGISLILGVWIGVSIRRKNNGME
jgi:hypothetical protein